MGSESFCRIMLNIVEFVSVQPFGILSRLRGNLVVLPPLLNCCNIAIALIDRQNV